MLSRAEITPQQESQGFNRTGDRGWSDNPRGNLQKLARSPLQMWCAGGPRRANGLAEPAKDRVDKLDRAGSIPLTVIYPKGSKDPVMLDGIYSVQDLQKAIDASASGQAPPAAVATAQPG